MKKKIEELKFAIRKRVSYNVSSKKFWAWIVTTILRIVSAVFDCEIIDLETWRIVTYVWMGIQGVQNVAHEVKDVLAKKKGEGTDG